MNNRNHSLLPIVFAIWQALYASAAPQAAACLKPLGLAMSSAKHATTAHHRQAAEKLAGGKRFLYVARMSYNDKERGYRHYLQTEERVSRDIAERIMASPPYQDGIREDRYWWVYSNDSPALAGFYQFDEPAVRKGIAIQMNEEGEQLLTSLTDLHSHPLGRMIERVRPDVVVIEDGLPIPEEVLRSDGSRCLIVRISGGTAGTDRLSRGAEVLHSVWEMSPADTAVFNFLPQTPEEAAPWDFPTSTAEGYAANARAFSSQLQEMGYEEVTPAGTWTRQTLVSAIGAAVDADKTILFLGEASEDGRSVRLPRTTEVLDAAALNELPRAGRYVGFSCNSQRLLDGLPGISVIGTVYTDVARRTLRTLLDSREPATATEYFEVHHPVGLLTPITELVGGLSRVTNAAARPALFRLDLKEAPVVPQEIRVVTPDPPETPLVNAFLAGVLGALSREFFRWRRLSRTGRVRLYLRPMYLGIATVQVLLGGAVALVFAPAIESRRLELVIAFVCGAGLEEIVRQANRLRVPSVPLGQPDRPRLGGEGGASLSEFMRA